MAQAQKLEPKAKETYDRLKSHRDDYTTRAEKSAKYTIPHLFPKDSDDGSTNYKTPYQSVGARGVNNLSSKILLALLPPNQPFFRLSFDQETEQKIAQSGDTELKGQLDHGLSLMEQSMMRYIEANSMRPTLFEAFKQLVVSGNSLLFLPPKEGGIKNYTMHDFVVQRDGIGNVLQIVAHDSVARGSVPQDILGQLPDTGETTVDAKVDIYTHVTRVEGQDQWQSYQEIEGNIISGSEQTYPLDKTPWIPLRFSKKDGEDYGRSFVDDYIGDLISLENLSKAMVDMSMIASKVIYLVNPASLTNVRQLSKSSSGDFVRGRPEDVVPMQLNKSLDLQIAKAEADEITSRVSFAFLLNSAVQRQGERVTAEEIRYVAGELEDTLGGVYSLLSEELQLPLVRCIFNQMQSRGMLPEIEGQAKIEPAVVTGIEALGRGHDLMKLQQFINTIIPFGEPAFQRLNFEALISRTAAALGVDTEGLIKSDEQLQQEQQAQQEAMAQQQGAQAAIQQQATQAQPQ